MMVGTTLFAMKIAQGISGSSRSLVQEACCKLHSEGLMTIYLIGPPMRLWKPPSVHHWYYFFFLPKNYVLINVYIISYWSCARVTCGTEAARIEYKITSFLGILYIIIYIIKRYTYIVYIINNIMCAVYLYIIRAWDTRGQGQLNWFRLITGQPVAVL